MFPESYPQYWLTTRENREKILAEIFKAVWKEKNLYYKLQGFLRSVIRIHCNCLITDMLGQYYVKWNMYGKERPHLYMEPRYRTQTYYREE